MILSRSTKLSNKVCLALSGSRHPREKLAATFTSRQAHANVANAITGLIAVIPIDLYGAPVCPTPLQKN